MDRIANVALCILRKLNQIEDTLVLSDRNGRYFSFYWLKPYSVSNVNDFYFILCKIDRIVAVTSRWDVERQAEERDGNGEDDGAEALRRLVSGHPASRGELQHSRHHGPLGVGEVVRRGGDQDLQRAERQDRHDEQETVEEEGGLNGRYATFIYIVTAFQTVFLPLQTVTAVYGMNFDVMPV